MHWTAACGMFLSQQQQRVLLSAAVDTVAAEETLSSLVCNYPHHIFSKDHASLWHIKTLTSFLSKWLDYPKTALR